MRRNSSRAKRIIDQCAQSDPPFEITGRQLEAWSIDGLGPPEGTPDERQVGHYRALAELSAPRRERDTVALRLAAQGFGCDRYKHILTELFAEAKVHEPVNPDNDETFESIEDSAATLSLSREIFGVLPGQVLSLLAKVLNAQINSAATILGETPDSTANRIGLQVVHTMVVEPRVVDGQQIIGDVIYDPQGIAAFLGVSERYAKQSGILGLIALYGRTGLVEAKQWISESSPNEIASIAAMIRDLLDRYSLPIRLDSPDLDLLAAYCAPLLVPMFGLMLNALGLPNAEPEQRAILGLPSHGVGRSS